MLQVVTSFSMFLNTNLFLNLENNFNVITEQVTQYERLPEISVNDSISKINSKKVLNNPTKYNYQYEIYSRCVSIGKKLSSILLVESPRISLCDYDKNLPPSIEAHLASHQKDEYFTLQSNVGDKKCGRILCVGPL
jgi:hypothetical protein